MTLLLISFLVFGLSSCGECTHEDLSSSVTEPTCTESGYTTYSCNNCDLSYTDNYVDAIGHTETVDTTVPPSCNNDGFTTYSCTKCGHRHTGDYVDATGHTEVIDAAVAPTCTESGLTEGKHCSVCNEITVAQEEVLKLEHNAGEWIIDIDATCKAEGSKHKECTVCNEVTETAVIDKLTTHTPKEAVTENIVPADCEKDGSYDLVVYCAVCDKELERKTEAIASGHKMVDYYCTECDYNEASEGLLIENTDGVMTVVGIGSCTDEIIVIPNVYSGMPVTSVKDYAFFKADKITEIVIPKNVKTIGDHAFDGIEALTRIVFSETVESISPYALGGCTSLLEIKVNEANPYYKSVDGNLYTKNGDTLIQYCAAKKESAFTVPDGVKTISRGAFKKALSLTEVILPEGLLTIGAAAFNYSNLTSITIPDSVTKIDDYAFQHSKSLVEVKFGKGLLSIGADAFGFCSLLNAVELPEGLTEIGNYAFSTCTSITSIKLPSTLVAVRYAAFENCTALTTLVMAEGISEIHERAFAGCTHLSSLTLASTIEYISSNTFAGCSALALNEYDNAYYLASGENDYFALLKTKGANIASCSIHPDTRVIASEAFYSHKSIQTITVPSGVSVIAPRTFGGCDVLYSVTLSEGLTKILSGAFEFCHNLEFINIPEGVTVIGDEAFKNCSLLASVVLPESIEAVGRAAFENCGFLGENSITIPDKIFDLHPDAFIGCQDEIYTVYENGCYLGSTDNPYTVLVRPLNSAEATIPHADTRIILTTN